ncbi:MAG: fibronectin type III domain-containing protein [Actinomycetota bacterium]
MPTVPGAPSISTVSLSQTSATLTWQAPSANGGRSVTSYTAIATAAGTEVGRCTTAATTCEITGLRAGTSHVFTVRAHNSVGAGANSPTYAASTAAVPVAASPQTPVAATPRAPTQTPAVGALALPPPPARVITASAGSGRTRISAVRSSSGTDVPVNEAIISVMTRGGRLLARIRVQVDSATPQVSVTVPYSAREVKVAVQFANDYGISEGGPVGVNVAEARTLEPAVAANQVKVVGTEVGVQAYFNRGSATLTKAGKAALA